MRIHTTTIELETRKKVEDLNVTNRIQQAVSESGIHEGIAFVFSGHTTAGVYLSNTDSVLPKDIQDFLEELIPNKPTYRHNLYGKNASAHMKSILVGADITLPVMESKVVLGQWQAIFFGEFDGPRKRKFIVRIMGE
ncbi:MAG: YjbQ family protein [Nitrospirae bacterium]|nr:YjbQ family protein [Nitrospirota bacterium]